MSGPITPKDAWILKRNKIPKAVFEAFNILIAKDLSDINGYSTVVQKEAIKLICKKMDIDISDFNYA
jgi:hypothetical protein